MRTVVQRVRSARIAVGAESVAEMGPGLLALVGVAADDGEQDARELARKLVHLRVLEDDAGRMNRSLLEAGATIHGITRERVGLPPDLCGFLEGRSRYARLGLMVHVTSALVQPGVYNHQVLEMGNVSGHPLRIHAGVRICQLVLMRTEGEAVYRGRFADQDRV